MSAWTQLKILDILDYPSLIEALIKNMDNIKTGSLALEVKLLKFYLSFQGFG